jgi:acetyl-CoA decarbonylase/synthase complex subunit delta
LERAIEKWVSKVNELIIGATQKEGGTRSSVIRVGGATTLPFLHFEGVIPNPPAIAMEVWDMEPADWPAVLKEPFRDVLDKPVEWAKRCVHEYGADFLCLRLASTSPDTKNNSPEEAARTVEQVLEKVSVPLMIIGCNQAEKDTEVIPLVSEVARGENCLVGIAVAANYKTITATCQSGGHSIIAESPIDINLAKQLNILIADMGFSPEKIVMHPATGALGYGLEYTYSIMERSRLAALQGDRMMSMPMINFVGQEVWRAKEAKASEEEVPEWGPIISRGPLWEATTAVSYLQAGADILVMCHPKAVDSVKKTIQELMKK